MKKNSILQDLVKNKWLYIMFLPVFIWYIVFSYAPMGGMVIAFQKYNIYKGLMHSPFVGFENFQRFFQDPYFFRLLRNTILLNLYGLLWGFPIPIIMALAFNEIHSKYFKSLTQTISYLPYFISTVVVVSIAVQFLSPTTGLINILLNKLGLDSVYFLQHPEYFRTILITMGIWQGSGFNAIIYMAALTSIPAEHYEAAIVDGATKGQQLRHVTLPGLVPTIVIMLIINLGSLLTVGHERIILMYNPLIYETADVLNTYIYRLGFGDQYTDFSYGQAISLFQNVIGFLLVYFSNKISVKLNETSLW